MLFWLSLEGAFLLLRTTRDIKIRMMIMNAKMAPTMTPAHSALDVEGSGLLDSVGHDHSAELVSDRILLVVSELELEGPL
jgi:hypothetical protein